MIYIFLIISCNKYNDQYIIIKNLLSFLFYHLKIYILRCIIIYFIFVPYKQVVFFFFMFQVTFWLASSHFHMTDQDKCFVLKYCLAFDIISKASKVCNKWLEYSFIKLLVVWNFVSMWRPEWYYLEWLK